MLINDSSTVACEVLVWFWEKNRNAGICGHIDLLQVRNGLIYLLDFKPEAEKEDEQKVASQLFFYASGLSFRTGIKLDTFRCAQFDNLHYFEFEPREVRINSKQMNQELHIPQNLFSLFHRHNSKFCPSKFLQKLLAFEEFMHEYCKCGNL